MSRAHLKVPVASLAIACSPIACERSSDTLNLFFADELVEAPARTIDLIAVSGVDCESLLSDQHDDAPKAGDLIGWRSSSYPIDPELNVLDDLPRGIPFALDVAAYDSNQLQVARACELVTLDAREATRLDIELRALPRCSRSPVTLDVVVVLDTSTAMEVADSTKVHLDELNNRVVEGTGLPGDTLFSVVTHGHTESASEYLAPTTDARAVHDAIESLRSVHHGRPLLYDAIHASAGLVRARAICGRKPALLVLLGGTDDGSTRFFEDAAIGIIATRGDATDDVYTFAIGLTLASYEVLSKLVPEEIGVVTGAETDLLRKAKLSEAATALRGLVP